VGFYGGGGRDVYLSPRGRKSRKGQQGRAKDKKNPASPFSLSLSSLLSQSLSCGADNLQGFEIPAEKTSISGEKRFSLDLGMGADQEIRDNPFSILFRSLRLLAPELTRKLRGLGRHRIEDNSQRGESLSKELLSRKVSADLGPYDLTNNERS
jgi:hypothetical protein